MGCNARLAPRGSPCVYFQEERVLKGTSLNDNDVVRRFHGYTRIKEGKQQSCQLNNVVQKTQ